MAQRRERLPSSPCAPHIEAQLEGNEPPRRVILRAWSGETKR